jgi:hypothetical protein
MVEKMVKIVGKIILYCLSMIALCIDARVSMEIRTDNGTHNQVVVGQPFILDVTIDDVYGTVQPPRIKGLEKFVARQSGSYMSSINGKSTARYSYQVRIDTIGSYVLGPATITHQQQEQVSNEVRVEVVKDVAVTQQQSNNSAQQSESKTFLRLMIDEESVVVGQKIGCTLRFYYQDTNLSLHNIGMPELPGFDIKEIGKLENGQAQVDGVSYRYAQWRWDMYPTKAGEFMIPAYHADYDLPVKSNHMLGSLFMFVNNAVDRKRVYSNALAIKVASLPYCDKPVSAVGIFESISADIKPGIVKEGEGMVLAIEIEGNGNLSAMSTPVLRLPAALKYYDSNSAIIAPQYSDDMPKKRFEYIVQGMQAGDYEIPEQLFTYFDVERHAYITLRTAPLAVSIMPGAAATTHYDNNIVKGTNVPHEQSGIAQQSLSIGDINVVGQWYPVAPQRSLPWGLFQLLFLLPCLYVVYPLIIAKCGNSRFFTRRRLLYKAQSKIKKAVKANRSQDLYVIFDEFAIIVRERGLSDEMMKEWHAFQQQIACAAYAQLDDENSEELCRMALQWMQRLKKII